MAWPADIGSRAATHVFRKDDKMTTTKPSALALRVAETLYVCGYWDSPVTGDHEALKADVAEDIDATLAPILAERDALREALQDLVDQIEGIGIEDWHGAEGLTLKQSRTALAHGKDN